MSNLLLIPIEGRLLDYEKKMSQEHGVNFMRRWLGVGEVVVVKMCKKEFGAYVTFTMLKELYEEHLTVARQVVVPQSREKLQEREEEEEVVLCLEFSSISCQMYTVHQ